MLTECINRERIITSCRFDNVEEVVYILNNIRMCVQYSAPFRDFHVGTLLKKRNRVDKAISVMECCMRQHRKLK